MLRRISPSEGRTSRGTLRYLNELRELARSNRQKATESEQIMWDLVRNRRLGYKFTRQKPIDRFVIDFYCSDLLLAIEIDGGYHQKRVSYDIERDKRLGWRNIIVIRYTDKDVVNDVETVLSNLKERIKKRVEELTLPNVPPCQGRD